MKASRPAKIPGALVASYLLGIMSHNFGYSLVLGDLSRDADPLPLVLALGRPKLAAVLAPDQHREYLIRVWLVEIEECRLSLGGSSVPRADDAAANGRRLAQVILGFARGELSLGCRRCGEDNCQ
jgi:hypothetical protein